MTSAEVPAPESAVAPTAEKKSPPTRIASLDQFRGYTVVGMFVVNFLTMDCIWIVLRHTNVFCSYADTIMPQFFFAVGYAYRLTFLRRLEQVGSFGAHWHAVKRNIGLFLLGFALYGIDKIYASWADLMDKGLYEFLTGSFQRTLFQTLVHIAVTSIWVMPVIARSAKVRVLFMLGSLLLHGILSHLFYFKWVWTPPTGIDGGVLGFLTWTVPMLVGSLVFDAMSARPPTRPPIFRLTFWALVIMGIAYALSCMSMLYVDTTQTWNSGSPTAESPVIPDFSGVDVDNWRALLANPPLTPPPFNQKPNYWMMSQRAGTPTYLIFGAGFSIAVLVIFIILCDLPCSQRISGGLRSIPLLGPVLLAPFDVLFSVFRTFGTNALASYCIHIVVMDVAVKPLTPKDSPLWFCLLMFGVFFGLTYMFVRHLERHGIYIKL